MKPLTLAAILLLLPPLGAQSSSLLVSTFAPGSVQTFAGSSGAALGTLVSSLSQPTGMLLAPGGQLLLSTGNSIQAFDAQCGSALGTFASGNGLNQPRDLLLAAGNRLLVANRNGNNVLEFDALSGSFVRVLASGGLAAPVGLALSGSGRLFVASLNNDSVLEYDGTTGALIGALPTGAELDGPDGLLFRPNGNLLVSSSLTDQVLEYQAPGWSYAGVFAQGGGLDNPIGLAAAPSGDLLVASAGSGEVLRFDGASGAPLGTFALVASCWDLVLRPASALPAVPGCTVSEYATVPGAFILDFAPSGELFVGNQTVPNTGVLAFAHAVSTSGFTSELGSARLLDPDCVVYDEAGLVSGLPGSVIVGGIDSPGFGYLARIAPDQSVTTLVAPTTTIENPFKLVFDPQGRLLCTDNQRSSLFVVGAGGSLSVLTALAAPASGLAVAPDGRIFTSYASGQVAVHAADGTLLDAAFASGLGSAPPLAFGPGGSGWESALYAIDVDDGELVRISNSGQVTPLGGGLANDQSDLAFGPDGALYISQVCARRVVRVEPNAVAYCPGHANSVSAGGAVLSCLGGFGSASASFLVSDTPNQPGLLYAGANPISVPFGCGLRCVGGTVTRGLPQVPSGHSLTTTFDMSLPWTIAIQWWYRDPAHFAQCGSAFNLSNALRP